MSEISFHCRITEPRNRIFHSWISSCPVVFLIQYPLQLLLFFRRLIIDSAYCLLQNHTQLFSFRNTAPFVVFFFNFLTINHFCNIQYASGTGNVYSPSLTHFLAAPVDLPTSSMGSRVADSTHKSIVQSFCKQSFLFTCSIQVSSVVCWSLTSYIQQHVLAESKHLTTCYTSQLCWIEFSCIKSPHETING